jgi:N-acetylmuramoyl-L-alanine amidase
MDNVTLGIIVIGMVGGAVGVMYWAGLFDGASGKGGTVNPGGATGDEAADLLGVPGWKSGVTQDDLFGGNSFAPISNPVSGIDLGDLFGGASQPSNGGAGTGQPAPADLTARERAWGLPDLDVLAKTLWGEARGEGLAGMNAVAAVIVNRVKSRRYPSTVKGVCLQPWQFSMWNEDDPNGEHAMSMRPGDSASYDQCLAVARAAIAGRVADPTGGALHYAVSGLNPYWAADAKISAQIGRHTFYVGVA